MQHLAFPRGPPPQSVLPRHTILLNFAVFGWEAVTQDDVTACATVWAATKFIPTNAKASVVRNAR